MGTAIVHLRWVCLAKFMVFLWLLLSVLLILKSLYVTVVITLMLLPLLWSCIPLLVVRRWLLLILTRHGSSVL